MWKQDVIPNLGLNARAGWCLEDVDNVFGASHAVSTTAKNSWALAVGRGTAHVGDRNLPNVAVPVYLTWVGDLHDGAGRQDYGHVVTWVPGTGLVSVKFKGNGHQVFASIADLERALPGSYLGWAEEVDTKRVVHYEAPAAPQPTADGRIPHSGTATVTTNNLNVRNAPNTNADNPAVAQYNNGGTFNYDSYIDANGYRWLSYVSFGGTRRYVAQGNGTTAWVKGGV